MRHIYGVQISIHSEQIKNFIDDQLTLSRRVGEHIEAIDVEIYLDGRVARLTLEEFRARIFGGAQVVAMPRRGDDS